jgi:hypothetical protein
MKQLSWGWFVSVKCCGSFRWLWGPSLIGKIKLVLCLLKNKLSGSSSSSSSVATVSWPSCYSSSSTMASSTFWCPIIISFWRFHAQNKIFQIILYLPSQFYFSLNNVYRSAFTILAIVQLFSVNADFFQN